MKPRIAYIDDDKKNLSTFECMLGNHFELKTYLSSTELLKDFSENTYEALIIDIYMPRMNGFEVLESVRRIPGKTTLPVFMITTCPSDEVRVSSFKLGATDFVDRLISKDELVARIESKISLRKKLQDLMVIGNMNINQRKLEVSIGNESPTLTLIEMKILFRLAGEYPGRVSKADLISSLWGQLAIHENNLNAQLYNLRLKLSSWTHAISNSKIHGLGIEPK